MLLIKILLLFLPLLPAHSNWLRIETEQHISFLFPYKPESLRKTINNIPSYIYQTKNLTTVFGVVCSDLGAKGIEIDNENVQRLYQELKTGSLSMESAYLKEERTIPYDNMIIKEIEYSIFKDNHEMTYFKRFIFRDNYVYQITIGGRTRFLNEIKAEKEVFFNSISFPASTSPQTVK